jgi:hypothetical protein
LEEGSQDQPIRSAQEALVAEEKGSDVARGAIDNSEDIQPHVFVGGHQREVNGMVHRITHDPLEERILNLERLLRSKQKSFEEEMKLEKAIREYNAIVLKSLKKESNEVRIRLDQLYLLKDQSFECDDRSPLRVTNTVDSSLSLSRSKTSKNLLRMFSKKQEKSVTRDSLTEESEASENEVYFNLKGESSDLGQEEEEEEMEFEEKPEKIERDRTGLSRGSVTNDVSRGRTATIP